MSRLWKSLKQAEKQRSSGVETNDVEPPNDQVAERRCSQRVLVHVPVIVRGRTTDHDPFQEETEAICVNACGGLITLTAGITDGQRLVLTNKVNQKEQECQVVYEGSTYSERAVVGVGFTQANPDFWL